MFSSSLADLLGACVNLAEMELTKLNGASSLSSSESSIVSLQTLDPCCTEISISLKLKDMDDGSKLIYDFGLYEFLDDPRSTTPLRDLVYTKDIFERIYVTTEGPTLVNPSKPVGLSLIDLTLKPCDEIMRCTSQKFCLHCLMEYNYSFWNRILPSAVGQLQYGAVVDIIRHGKLLVNYERSLSYGNVFPVPLEVDKSGKHRFIAGRKDFKSVGDIAIDISMWKVYWLAVRRTYPSIERKVWFRLHVICSDNIIPRICLDLHYKIGKQERIVKVVFPHYGNLWSALTQAFALIPSSALAADSLPFSYLSDVKNSIQD